MLTHLYHLCWLNVWIHEYMVCWLCWRSVRISAKCDCVCGRNVCWKQYGREEFEPFWATEYEEGIRNIDCCITRLHSDLLLFICYGITSTFTYQHVWYKDSHVTLELSSGRYVSKFFLVSIYSDFNIETACRKWNQTSQPATAV